MIFIGFILGFVGYLPLGNINLTVVQLAVSESKTKMQGFILFAAFMEFVYCFGCMMGMQALLKQQELVVILNWLGAAVFLALGLYSFLAAARSRNTVSGAARGVVVAILNPLQIPFWMIWGAYVLDKGWVKPDWNSIATFSALCSLGTIAVLYMYAIAGKRLVEKLSINQSLLNRGIGSLLILLAVFQIVKNVGLI